MKRLARKNVLDIKPYIPGKPIEEVKRELGLKVAVKLASNENALPPSPKMIRAARNALSSLNRYPDGGCFYLKKALARYAGLGTDNIVIGNGSDEIIVLALRAFVKEGDEVVVARPTFLIYEIASRVQGAKIKVAPLKNFKYDVQKIARLVSRKTKMIFIANPDNPTGTYITKEEVDYLLSRTPKDTIVYFDEAYYEFAKDVRDFPKTVKYLFNRNVIVTRSFSKIYSLAGLRIGYGISNKFIIECLNRVREPFNINSVAQAAAMAALSDAPHVKKTKKLVEEGKAFLYKELDGLKLSYIPSVTNFILVNLKKDTNLIYQELLRRGVIVREMSAWKLKSSIRVTVGTMSENRKFIQALKELL
jgi:histidinol-phosphate aminotransferase